MKFPIYLFLIALWPTLSLATGEPAEVSAVQTRSFDIDYFVNETALPLDSVQLWYTSDGGAKWLPCGFDEDRQPPIAFQAPTEGTFGFYVIVSNSAGPSSPAPSAGTRPQLCAFIDFTPPVVQLQPLNLTQSALGDAIVEIRWSAIDANLGARPIQLFSQRPPETSWQSITTDALANTGRYDLRLPADFKGPLAIKAVVTDLGGHRVETERQVIEVTKPSTAPSGQPNPVMVKDNGAASVSRVPAADAKLRADQLFAESQSLKQAKDYRQAIAKLREVVKLDGQRADAFSEMGGMLYELGDFERANGAYDVALKFQPSMRSGLIGAANVHRQRKEYPLAADKLRTLLHYYPKDAEGWLYLGDVAVFQGDESLAREHYTRATQIDPQATQTINEARQRLAMMAEVSRSYRGDKK